MADEKRKEIKAIHADQLIIYADHVIIRQKGKEIKGEEAPVAVRPSRRQLPEVHSNRDIFGFPILPPAPQQSHETDDDSDSD